MNRIGELTICRDSQQLNMYLYNHDKSIPNNVIVLDDDSINYTGFIGGGILLPPLNVWSILVDSPPMIDVVNGIDPVYQTFANAYMQYLNMDRDVNDMITTIVTALYKGKDIVFLLNNIDPSLIGFVDVLITNFNSRGIVIMPFELKNPQMYYPSINISWIPYWLDMMISFGKITDEEYNSRLTQSDNSPFQKLNQ